MNTFMETRKSQVEIAQDSHDEIRLINVVLKRNFVNTQYDSRLRRMLKGMIDTVNRLDYDTTG